MMVKLEIKFKFDGLLACEVLCSNCGNYQSIYFINEAPICYECVPEVVEHNLTEIQKKVFVPYAYGHDFMYLYGIFDTLEKAEKRLEKVMGGYRGLIDDYGIHEVKINQDYSIMNDTIEEEKEDSLEGK